MFGDRFYSPDQSDQKMDRKSYSLQTLWMNTSQSEPDLYSASGSELLEDRTPTKLTKTQELLCKLGLDEIIHGKLTPSDFLKISDSTLEDKTPSDESELVHAFMHRLLRVDYTARHVAVKNKPNIKRSQKTDTKTAFLALSQGKTANRKEKANVHPMDLQMAVFLSADRFLQQVMITKLSECQYAVPLLVPNPITEKIELPFWAMCQIKKSWNIVDPSGTIISKAMNISKAETPMVAFFRLGSVSTSKSKLMNHLIGDRQDTFFHKDCEGSNSHRFLTDGLVEITWYCPSGKKSDHFSDCVAFCNLHGDGRSNPTQREILMQTASVNVVLLPPLGEDDAILEHIWKLETPLIVLHSEEGDDNEDDHEAKPGKYLIGVKGKNLAALSDVLRSVINDCLRQTPSTFSLEKMKNYPAIILDEHDNACKGGKEAARQIAGFLIGKEPLTIKEQYLPCQGKLWHDWCQKSKELRRIKSLTQAEVSKKQHEMMEIRRKQQKLRFTELMGLLFSYLNSHSGCERKFFLKWTGIMLDDFTSDKLSAIRLEYATKWKEVNKLKLSKKRGEIKTEQSNLENISKKLSAATLGLEHILREMGQIYEAAVSETKTLTRKSFGYSYLPTVAAELMIDGHPMELMDGDTAYVPLIWVSAVLEELIKKLGDQRVYVLSVLGIQSSGKSTMLNAMFGLEFAVSAGRCTKGAFMQLVKVSDEMQETLKFAYILVIETEGLRALELAENNTILHDNELSTFVVGLGNMTLINIFGENPSDLQEILQIVVHAFLRMKKVKLNPSCMFVHQNVSDIAAKEKVMDGRIRLHETLDKMTKLAAKDESYYAEHFTDVIAFDVDSDVKYFAPLWAGSPPMAPPNPHYSDNIQELKRHILSHASTTSCLNLSQFQQRVKDLWEALLNENFVFSFRNAQEIQVYRKLEQEYGKWAWSLRAAMLAIEDKMLNRVASGNVETVLRQDLINEMAETFEDVQKAFVSYFEEDGENETLAHWKSKFEQQIQHLHNDLINEAKIKVDESINQKRIRRKLDRQRESYERKLFEKSKELALKLKANVDSETQAKAEFDTVWGGWVSKLAEDAPVIREINVSRDVADILGEIYPPDLVNNRKHSLEYNLIRNLRDYNSYVPRNIGMFRKDPMSMLGGDFLKPHENRSVQDLIFKAMEQTRTKVETFLFAALGYHLHYIKDIVNNVRTLVEDLELDLKEKKELPEELFVFNKAFYVDLSFYVCEQVEDRVAQLHNEYKKANDPLIYFEEKKGVYFAVFQKYWEGASSAAILGDQVCSKLKEPILQSVYNRIARFVCGQMRGMAPFHGNRADLEKYILKSLAEQTGTKDERFQNYLIYMYYPWSHFVNFIKGKVTEFMEAENPQAEGEIKECIDYKQNVITSMAAMATAEVKRGKGDAKMWLDFFCTGLADEFGDTRVHSCDEEAVDRIDYDVLADFIKKEVSTISKELKSKLRKLSDFKMEKFRQNPDKILVNHFCMCCWEQCPFCGAVCTNSLRDHPGDHNVDFHRTAGMNGMHYQDSQEFFIDFCTAAVASDDSFCPPSASKATYLFKEYRTAGGKYAKWRISTDFSELEYWKWFLCEFRENLEKYHNKKFTDRGKLPDEWKNYNQLDAVASLRIHTSFTKMLPVGKGLRRFNNNAKNKK